MSIFKPNIDKFITDNDLTGLMKCLENKNPEIRMKSFMALLRVAVENGDASLLNALGKLKNDRDLRVRNTAILKLAAADDGSRADLRLIMREGLQNEKIEALRLLAERGETTAEVSAIIILGLNDKKGMVQIEAIRTMGSLKDPTAVYHLEEKLHDERYAIRLEAVSALSMIGTDAAVAPLIGALTDNRIEVRRSAREFMEKIATPMAVKALNDAPLMMMVKRMNESVTAKIDALHYISKHRMMVALPLVHKATSDEYKNVRLEAVRVLSLLKDRASINTLGRMVGDQYFDIRLEAVRALEKFIDPSVLAPLEKATQDRNKSVRDEAKKAFYSLKARLEETNRA